jgi:F0F1-type ATP synthase membrane subunit a
VGILELISEIAKIISFSFRLFGNIFAGEVLLNVMLICSVFCAAAVFVFGTVLWDSCRHFGFCEADVGVFENGGDGNISLDC